MLNGARLPRAKGNPAHGMSHPRAVPTPAQRHSSITRTESIDQLGPRSKHSGCCRVPTHTCVHTHTCGYAHTCANPEVYHRHFCKALTGIGKQADCCMKAGSQGLDHPYPYPYRGYPYPYFGGEESKKAGFGTIRRVGGGHRADLHPFWPPFPVFFDRFPHGGVSPCGNRYLPP